MPCPRCQAATAEGARFCEDCGARLEQACPSCSQPIGAGKKFCRSCGAVLPGDASPGPTPAAYTPRHLAERILTSKSALEGERKQVTVLFADLKGSMELLADRDPEEARKILDPVLERMMEAVHRYEGTVNQVMGDGIMALFGAPVAHEDHAVRACYAAIDLQAGIRRYAEDVRRAHGMTVQVRVGLHSGEVVVRTIGSDLRMDYTAVGQTTHLAARMEQLAKPETTLLTADTLRLAEGFIAVTPLGPVPVKGLEVPVEVYELTGAGPFRSRLHAAVTRSLTRFVGRAAELEQLRQAIGRAAGGHGQLVAIVGEPGVGKSRLVWEVTHSHRTHGWRVAQAGAVSYGKATPYLPVVDLLKSYFQIEDRDDARTVQEKVTGKLLTLDRALEPTLPAFLSLLDVSHDDASWQALDPPQRRQRTLEAMKRLLLRESQVQPLLLVVEDLHWIDSETQALLDRLVESVPPARLLILVNYRPEYAHCWGGKTYYIQLRLDPLPPERAGELLGALLGPDPGLRPLGSLLIERTEGNPFFLEESVRMLADTGVLVGERGGYRLAKPLAEVGVPATVHTVLAARIDRLLAEDKHLLQSAAVIGKDVPVALLEAIAELPKEALRRGLAHLQAAEFLYETQVFPEPEYSFKHALTHEVAYGSLLSDRRRRLHTAVVEALERRQPDAQAPDVDRLAHHAIQGEAWDRAVAYARRAGAQAFDQSANQEAAGWFEQAIGALSRVADSRERREAAVDLRLALRNALVPLRGQRAVIDLLAEAQALAETLGDPRRVGWVAAYRVHALSASGDSAGAVASGERAIALADQLGDLGLQVFARSVVGTACVDTGDLRRAVSLFQWGIEAVVGPVAQERFGTVVLASVFTRAWAARCLAELGEFVEARGLAREAVRLAEAADHPFSLVVGWWAAGWVDLGRGAFSDAIRALEHALAASRTWSIMLYLPRLIPALARAYAGAERREHAESLVAELRHAAEQEGRLLVPRDQAGTTLAELHLRGGRVEAADEAAQAALDRCRAWGFRAVEGHALHVLGEVAARREPPDLAEAERRFEAARALASELGMRPLVAHCHLGLGRLFRGTGDGAKAAEHLTTAATMYREMDMASWLRQAEELAAT